MKVYYSLIKQEDCELEDSIIDDYVVDTGIGILQVDAQSGEMLHKYKDLKDYLESYPDSYMVEIDYE